MNTITDIDTIKVYLIPGKYSDNHGLLPQQGRAGDRGFDCFAAAISDGTTDPQYPYRLKRLWDFGVSWDKCITDHIKEVEVSDITTLAYMLMPDEEVILGLGMTFDMGKHWSAKIAPRSSTAGLGIRPRTSFPPPYSAVIPNEDRIGDMYADVPIDGNFTGEPRTVLKNFGKKPFSIYYGRKITQLVFEGGPRGSTIPRFQVVTSRDAFQVTTRNGASHGSSGHHITTEQLGLGLNDRARKEIAAMYQ